MLLLPDFIKAIGARNAARKLAAKLDGTVEKEGGPSPKIHVLGKHRERQVEVDFAVSWGFASVKVTTTTKRDLYFFLRSKSGLKKMAPGRDREYEELDFAKRIFIKWKKDEDRLDARRIIAGLEPGLRDRMLSPVKGKTTWNHTADGLQYDRVCGVFGTAERLIKALDLACNVAEGIETLATRPGFRNADSPQ